jgi:two-component system sensor histidine kinase UhpB
MIIQDYSQSHGWPGVLKRTVRFFIGKCYAADYPWNYRTLVIKMDDHTIKILLIEDNPGDARLIREMLRDVIGQSFALDWVSNLAEGLERESRGGIDLVLLDLGLPDSKGLDTFAKAYEQAPLIPFIVLTGLADESLALSAVRKGAQDYLFKNEINPNLLVRAIRYAIERKRAEIALEAERKKLFSVLNSLPAFVHLKDPDFKICFANRYFAEVFGEAGDKPCYEFLRGRSEPCEDCQALKVLTTKIPQKFESTINRRTYEVHNHPFYTDDGPKVLTIGFDITERKRAEEVLQCQHEQLEIQVRERTKELTEINETLKLEIAERKRTEKALMDSRQNLQLLASQLLTIQEEERRRVFTEIYDGIGQTIAGIKMHLNTIVSQLGKNQKTLKVSCEQILTHINIVIDKVRNISWDSTISIIEELGFSSSLSGLVEKSCRNNQMESFVVMDKIDNLFPLEKQINIYRIFQELMANIVRHSYATKVAVSIERHGDHVYFLVKDNGKGFDQEKVLSGNDPKRGLGLTMINERARLIGGSLAIRTQKDQGTIIHLTVPLMNEVTSNLTDHNSQRSHLVGIGDMLPKNSD